MDPTRTSRRDFTTSLTSHVVPQTADPQYRNLAKALRNLLTLLVNHEAMSRNIGQKLPPSLIPNHHCLLSFLFFSASRANPPSDQTYSTPATSKNKVYFMWDFVGRTLAMLYGLPPSLPSNPAPPPPGVNTPGGPEAWMAKQKQAWMEGESLS
jgi:hypothetical protein